MEIASLRKKLVKIITKNIRVDVYIAFVVLFLIFISALTILNLISTVRLRQQTEYILKEVMVYDFQSVKEKSTKMTEINSPGNYTITMVDARGNIISGIPKEEIISAEKPIANQQSEEEGNIEQIEGIVNTTDNSNQISSQIAPPSGEAMQKPVPSVNVYSNIAVDNFSNSYFFDKDKTTLHFNQNSTVLTFPPVYDFSYYSTCDESFCGFKKDRNKSCLNGRCLTQSNNQIYYEGEEVVIPDDLRGRNISQIGLHPLKTKWVISFLISSDNQDMVYLYFLENKSLKPLIDQNASLLIKTKYGKGKGYVDVAGDDTNFLIVYSGYEGLAYLYRNGVWQDVSIHFGLRVMDGGFKAQIVKSGENEKTIWYVCSQDESRSRLIKLWQNGTNQIQGSLDLSSISGEGAAGCALKSPGELLIAKNNTLYLFKDKGFDNSRNYFYFSNNLSSFSGKKVVSAQMSSYIINANPGTYNLYLSCDRNNWILNSSEKIEFNNPGSGLYVKAEFQKGDVNYSPWFQGIRTIPYQAID